MCEHAGLLNHAFAKIDDLQIDERTVVAETAPQCFDISLWQLMAALLTGGRVVIVGQETILEAKRFIDRIVDARVNIVRGRPADLLLVDNLRTAHGREPFEGPREVVVAMADPVRVTDCSPTIDLVGS